MNASEKEITGVEDMNGLGSIRDAVMQQAVTLARLDARDESREKARNEARESDQQWKAHMTENVGKLFDAQGAMKTAIAEIPAAIDRRVAAALVGQEELAAGRRRLITTVIIVVGLLIALGAAAGLEYLDHENAAGRVLLILMPLVTLAGWYVSSRKK